MRFGLHLKIMSILYVFSLLLLLEVPKSCIAEKKEEKWDHFIYAQQWPKGYCDSPHTGTRKCRIVPEKFVIHGLWPQKENGTHPKCRTKTPIYRRVSISFFVMVN